MNDILKQRLVGALILVALGVVFWPIIFVEPGERAAAEQLRIPPPPDVDMTPIETPVADDLQRAQEWRDETEPEQAPAAEDPIAAFADTPAAADEAPLQEALAADAPAARVAAPEQAVLDSKGVPVAWILQVASVSSEDKANGLRDRLLAMQEKAYVKKLDRNSGTTLYRVYVGPNFERAQLEKIQADIDSRFKVKSLIIRYVP